ncbi:MAG: rhodanese-like domain-containing protein [Saprospiraceae bacterium]
MTKFFTTLFFLGIGLTLSAQVFLNVDVHQADSIIKANEDNPIFTLLDVRTQGEYDGEHLANAYMRDFYADDFREQLDALSKDRVYLIYCRSGNRSGQAFNIMKELEFTEVYNMLGGITSWKNADYPVTTDLPAEQDLTTDIHDLNIQSLSLSPNPVSDNLVLDNLQGAGAIKIYTAMGQLVSDGQLSDNVLSVTHLPKGAYLLQFIPEDENSVFIGRFLKL